MISPTHSSNTIHSESHSSSSNSGRHSTCVYNVTHHCLAPNHSITSENECFTRKELFDDAVCKEAGQNFNTCSEFNKIITPIFAEVATHLNSLLGGSVSSSGEVYM
jgi:hypothetical protein